MLRTILYLFILIYLLNISFLSAEVDHFTKETIASGKNSFKAFAVMFYAPWCGHSRNLLPIWDTLENNDKEIGFGKVDCVKEEFLYWEHDIIAFPTIHVFMGGEDGTSVIYDGDNDADSIRDFTEKLSEPFARNVNILSDGLLDKATHALLTINNNDNKDDNDKLISKFDAACKKVGRVPCFYKHSSSSSLSSLEVSFYDDYVSVPEMVTITFDIDNNKKNIANDMVNIIANHSYPHLVPLYEDTRDVIFSKSRPGFRNHIIIAVNDVSTRSNQYLLSGIRNNVANTLAGECVFIYLDVSRLNDYQESIMSQLKIDSNDAPVVTAILSRKDKIEFYKLKKDDVVEIDRSGNMIGNSETSMSSDSVIAWTRSVLDGELEAHFVNQFNPEQ